MKSLVKMSMFMAIIAFAMTSCQKDNGPDLVSGAFDGKITATVESSARPPAQVGIVVAWNDPDIVNNRLVGNQIGYPVQYASNRFSITLPNPPEDANMYTVKNVFEEMMNLGGGKPKYSNASVKITSIDLLGFNSAGTTVYGTFECYTPDQKTMCTFVYAEGDVNITGGKNLTVSLKKGWNRWFYTENVGITTKAPEELRWYFVEL